MELRSNLSVNSEVLRRPGPVRLAASGLRLWPRVSHATRGRRGPGQWLGAAIVLLAWGTVRAGLVPTEPVYLSDDEGDALAGAIVYPIADLESSKVWAYRIPSGSLATAIHARVESKAYELSELHERFFRIDCQRLAAWNCSNAQDHVRLSDGTEVRVGPGISARDVLDARMLVSSLSEGPRFSFLSVKHEVYSVGVTAGSCMRIFTARRVDERFVQKTKTSDHGSVCH